MNMACKLGDYYGWEDDFQWGMQCPIACGGMMQPTDGDGESVKFGITHNEAVDKAMVSFGPLAPLVGGEKILNGLVNQVVGACIGVCGSTKN